MRAPAKLIAGVLLACAGVSSAFAWPAGVTDCGGQGEVCTIPAAGVFLMSDLYDPGGYMLLSDAPAGFSVTCDGGDPGIRCGYRLYEAEPTTLTRDEAVQLAWAVVACWAAVYGIRFIASEVLP